MTQTIAPGVSVAQYHLPGFVRGLIVASRRFKKTPMAVYEVWQQGTKTQRMFARAIERDGYLPFVKKISGLTP